MRIAISGEVPAKGYDLNEFLWIVKSLDVSAIEIWPENIPYHDGTNPYTRSYDGRDIDYAREMLLYHLAVPLISVLPMIQIFMRGSLSSRSVLLLA